MTATDRCGVPWGCCPCCALGLVSSAGLSWCEGCGQLWATAAREPCPDAPVATIADQPGTEVCMCLGHAARALLDLRAARVVSGGADLRAQLVVARLAARGIELFGPVVPKRVRDLGLAPAGVSRGPARRPARPIGEA